LSTIRIIYIAILVYRLILSYLQAKNPTIYITY